MSRTHLPATLLVALLFVACDDRETAPTAPPVPEVPVAAAAGISPETEQLEGLARRVALALRNPAFRREVKARLDASPFPEGKIHLQRFLAEGGRMQLRAVARANQESESVTDSVARITPALEAYLPVPEHRRRWN